LVDEEFSADNGMLTTTFKLKRNFGRVKYAKEIAELYKQVANSKL